ncbi:MAG: phosphopantetheinyl transferase, partial [Rhodobacteraceae bacterium]|nr:phosphopantetheinyl transferase [Paracoccaceae bacterium]
MPDLAAALRLVLPAGVALGLPVAGDAPLEDPGPVVALRRAEFAAGRSAARAAMAGLNLPPLP